MDQDRTALLEQSDLGPHCLSTRLQIVSWTKNIHFVILYAYSVNKCEFSVLSVRIFMKCTHVCAVQKA